MLHLHGLDNSLAASTSAFADRRELQPRSAIVTYITIEERIMERPRQRASDTEPIQADPQLRLSQGGRATGIHITLVAIACMLLVSLMIYALNQPTTEDVAATAPAAQETTGAPAPGAAAPQTGGNVAGGENAAPPTEAAPQNQPAQEPVPQQTKPGVVPDDSQR